jgi:hypothetical protein
MTEQCEHSHANVIDSNCAGRCDVKDGIAGSTCRAATTEEVASALLRNKLPDEVYHVER